MHQLEFARAYDYSGSSQFGCEPPSILELIHYDYS